VIRVVALLAAVFFGLGLVSCGGGGAEPGAPEGATLVLDFEPNAVHAGLYAAQAEGYFDDEELDLTIREPSSTADSAKLLEAGRADFAIMDINDFGLARERGLDLSPIAAIVQRPLASVIAADREAIQGPADLAGKSVGVTGVPSDDAVLDTILRSGGVDPDDVHRVNIGFNAVAALAGGKVDAATAFWNAEGVQLQQMDVPTREFRVDEFGAPRYPELLIVTRSDQADELPALALESALSRGYELLGKDPDRALDDLAEEVPGLDKEAQTAQLDALRAADAFARGGETATARLDPESVAQWRDWATKAGLLQGG
jgi:putative hydroxymethylpyrimidine transport system substrate-binding protein